MNTIWLYNPNRFSPSVCFIHQIYQFPPSKQIAGTTTTYRHLCNLYKTILNRRRLGTPGAVGSNVLSSKFQVSSSTGCDMWYGDHESGCMICTHSWCNDCYNIFYKRERSRNPNIIWHLSQPIGWIWLVVSSGFAKVIFVFWTALLPRTFILPANLPAWHTCYLSCIWACLLAPFWRAVAAPALLGLPQAWLGAVLLCVSKSLPPAFPLHSWPPEVFNCLCTHVMILRFCCKKKPCFQVECERHVVHTIDCRLQTSNCSQLGILHYVPVGNHTKKLGEPPNHSAARRTKTYLRYETFEKDPVKCLFFPFFWGMGKGDGGWDGDWSAPIVYTSCCFVFLV